MARDREIDLGRVCFQPGGVDNCLKLWDIKRACKMEDDDEMDTFENM